MKWLENPWDVTYKFCEFNEEFIEFFDVWNRETYAYYVLGRIIVLRTFSYCRNEVGERSRVALCFFNFFMVKVF